MSETRVLKNLLSVAMNRPQLLCNPVASKPWRLLCLLKPFKLKKRGVESVESFPKVTIWRYRPTTRVRNLKEPRPLMITLKRNPTSSWRWAPRISRSCPRLIRHASTFSRPRPLFQVMENFSTWTRARWRTASKTRSTSWKWTTQSSLTSKC